MDVKQFLECLKNSNVPTGSKIIKPDALKKVLQNEPSQRFLAGICRTLSASNVLNVLTDEEAIKEEELSRMEVKLEGDCKAKPPNMHVIDKYCKNPEDFEASVLELEAYVSSLQEKNSQLQNMNKDIRKKIKSEEQFVKQTCLGESSLISKNRENNSKLENDLLTLKENCQELHNLVCKSGSKPYLVYQLPLNPYKAEKKSFDDNVKIFIIKQFEERSALLAGQNEPTDCSQHNPRELHHLVAGPEKKKYEWQCQELNRSEAGFGAALRDKCLIEARIEGLQAAIKTVEQWNESRSKHGETELTSEAEIAGLEARVASAAADCAARKVGLIVTGNYLVKQRRQRYYLEHLDTLETLLRQRLSLDKLLCTMIQIEGSLAEEVCTFLQAVTHHFDEVCGKLAENLGTMDERVRSISQPPAERQLAVLLRDLLEGPPEDGSDSQHEEAARLVQVNLALDQLIRDSEIQLLQNNNIEIIEIKNRLSGQVFIQQQLLERVSATHSVQEAVLRMEPELQLCMSKVDKYLQDFNLQMKRQRHSPRLRLLSKLWALFIVCPEKLPSLVDSVRAANLAPPPVEQKPRVF